MKNEEISLKYNKKIINLKVKKCNFFEKLRGLMFRRRNTENLLFEFKKPGKTKIHSFFVFFPFVVVWLDNDNKIVEIRIVKPFTFYINSKKSFKKIIEIPMNEKNSKTIKSLVGD